MRFMIIASSPRDDDGCRTLQPRIEINSGFRRRQILPLEEPNLSSDSKDGGVHLVLKTETKREIPCACVCCKCLAQARCDQNGHLESETNAQILREKKGATQSKQSWSAM